MNRASLLVPSIFCVVFLMFVSINSSCQIYEATSIDEYRVPQYDTLNIETVTEYLMLGEIKRLKSIKKYDPDGFIVEQSDYSEEEDLNTLKAFIRYAYNSDTTECVEVWMDPEAVTTDTAYISTKTYALDGRILMKTEWRSYSGVEKKYSYNYDAYRNCESIHHDYWNRQEHFENDYDSQGRIIRQLHTHETGTEYEHLRAYNRSGKIERNSMNNAQLVEIFTFNDQGNVSMREYILDSTLINKDAVFSKTCVEGSDKFEYDLKGRIIFIQNLCKTYMSEEHPYFMPVGEKFEYDEHGLLKRHEFLVSDRPEEYVHVSSSYLFDYKVHQTKK